MGRIVLLVLCLSLIFRIIFITTSPPELFGDEIDVGYQALSLFTTGRDLYRQPLPVYIHSLSEWRAPLLIYFTVPTVALISHPTLAVRMPEVIFGTLGPVLLFLLVFLLTQNKQLSFISSLILVTSPWHIHYSRSAFEVVILLDLLMLATILLIKKRHLLSLLFFALCLYTYSIALIFIPLLLLILKIIYPVSLKKTVVHSLYFVLLVAPIIYFVVLGPARNRFQIISLTSQPQVISEINASRLIDKFPTDLVFHNKMESFLRQFSSNFYRAYSSEFLFISGDPTFRHSLHYVGQLLPITAPFLVYGLIISWKKRYKLMYFWLLLAPVPASLTADGGLHATRLFIMLPPLTFFVANGIYCLAKLKPLLFSSLIFLMLSAQILFVGHYYIVHYPVLSWRWWHKGYEKIMTNLNNISPQYKRIFINNTYEPSLIRFLYYTRYPPRKFHRNFTIDQPQKDIFPGYDGFTIENKFYFGSFSNNVTKNGISNYLRSDSLYIISQRDDVGGDWDWRKDPPSGVKVLNTSVNPQNTPILYLVTKDLPPNF